LPAWDPLAEARAIAALIQRHGWRQRRIAEEIGCSQAHVSERMSLQRLPEQARGALADGAVTVETALGLQSSPAAGEAAGEAISEALRDLQRGQHPAYPISAAKDRVSVLSRPRKPGRTWGPGRCARSPSIRQSATLRGQRTGVGTRWFEIEKLGRELALA